MALVSAGMLFPLVEIFILTFTGADPRKGKTPCHI